eukprot:Gregarina_sp_Pseudo_9__106@NODE_1070_length_1907_cov_25_941113_g1002_i0_p1_GENE_NODE_1070_length_1907_cov_25_941113_g1002_i0NODE_1070_length_1907_cov_25_941113_g1002_i0_p1_ORF_typecomplete_len480_score163_24tRNAsynt_2d/PF01409_20/5_7e68PheRS_DBD1/PF18552_1/2e12tRNA_synthFbeta/PF17759_1/5_1e02tRNA_synthFbeta/PF17759_1/1_9e02tRNA_synthFbeta/PF17759_1/1_2e06PheRS_DBD3/PF18553_1/0_00015PheRS_DBD3/PF18553_1/3_1e02tRNAsynt_2/PF00152_20/0_00014tRNAsynt_His/PF13393_6/4_9e02tRNAsynt_His/PF13393_6/0_0015M
MADKEAQQLQVLQLLNELFDKGQQNPDTLQLAKALEWDHAKVVGIVKSLEMMGKITTANKNHTEWKLTDEGAESVTQGSPEFRVVELLRSQGPQKADVLRQKGAETWKALGLNTALKNKWAQTTDGVVSLTKTVPETDPVRSLLQEVKETPSAGVSAEEELKTLAKRKLVAKNTVNFFELQKTANFSTTVEKLQTDLSKDMLLAGTWKDCKFKAYNFNAAGIVPKCGSVHPLMQTLNMFRNILVQMGFNEMPTQRWVENCFWNFDALFQPQTHPVRDAHDTFFVKSPALADLPDSNASRPPLDYFNRVRKMHESGDDMSLGWQCDWEPMEARKLIMRTHTTAISSQMLMQMGADYQQTGVFQPKRFFSIDRVFRNETLDATHLAEFYQVEGVVAERGASLATLMGIIASFFAKIGITQLKYKPAYNPYTEPSMEIFGFHPTMNKWTEIGNSGVFRPEMLRPMGLPDDVVVLGWGLSLER